MHTGDARDKAIKTAVNQCIQNNMLADFLNEHYKEVCDMFDYGITYEEEKEVIAEEAMERGMEKGMEKGMLHSALKFIQNGTSLADAISILGLSDSQAKALKEHFA